MDVVEPAGGVIGRVSIGVLRALASRSTPMTAAQVVRQAEHGTPAGVRRALERLADEGVVGVEHLGDLATYFLNFDHILYPTFEGLLDVHKVLPRRLRAHFRDWDPGPAFAALFGSVARADGGQDSDVDILLVQPPMGTASRRRWNEQVHRLRRAVLDWTGNQADVTDLRMSELRRLSAAASPLIKDAREHLVVLAGDEPDELSRTS